MPMIDECLKKYGYKLIGDIYIKPILNSVGNTVLNVVFSKTKGHHPLQIIENKRKKPRILWRNKKHKVTFTEENIEQLCQDVDNIAKLFKVKEIEFNLKNI